MLGSQLTIQRTLALNNGLPAPFLPSRIGAGGEVLGQVLKLAVLSRSDYICPDLSSKPLTQPLKVLRGHTELAFMNSPLFSKNNCTWLRCLHDLYTQHFPLCYYLSWWRIFSGLSLLSCQDKSRLFLWYVLVSTNSPLTSQKISSWNFSLIMKQQESGNNLWQYRWDLWKGMWVR